jgi:hypothetical protein
MKKPLNKSESKQKMKVITGIDKGFIGVTMMDGNNSRPPTKKDIQYLIKREQERAESNSLEIADSFIDYLMSDREILKSYLLHQEKMNALKSSKIITTQFARMFGKEETQKKAEIRYQIAKEIFEILESKGEKLPIKRSQIEKVIHPIWKLRGVKNPPKEKTLFDYQKRYLAEKK